MLALNSTDVRREWSSIVDAVVRDKPQFIKRTRDYMFLSNVKTLESLLSAYTFHVGVFDEDDGSVTLSLDEIDLVENGVDLNDAITKLAYGILDYSEDYYREFSYWARGSRVSHIPYVLKALIINDVKKIGDLIVCRPGKT